MPGITFIASFIILPMIDFDERAVPGLTSNFLMREAQSRYLWVNNRLGSKAIVLDAATGTGYGANILSSKAEFVMGVDIDPGAISFASKKYMKKNIEFKVLDVNKINVEKKFTDIVAFEMIEHLENPDRFLNKLLKVIDRKGVLYVSTPNTDRLGHTYLQSPFHVKEYNASQLKKLLSKYFNKVEIFGQYQSKRATDAYRDFMKSQKARQSIVDSDKLGIRKFVPREFKEFIWKYFGAFFGRATQSGLTELDFKIDKLNGKKANYLVAVCKNPKLA